MTVAVADIPDIVRQTLDDHRQIDGPTALDGPTCLCGWWSPSGHRRWIDHLIDVLSSHGINIEGPAQKATS